MMELTLLEKDTLVRELCMQDELLTKIFQRRKEIANLTKDHNCYNEVWEMLNSDSKIHSTF